MKIFLSSDMEGTAGVVDWTSAGAGQREYEYYRALLQDEVNAAIEGAMAAGATEFLVNDSHSTMANLRPDALAGRARYLSGRHKPHVHDAGARRVLRRDLLRLLPRLDGQRAGSTLSHTYNPRGDREVLLNGVVAGEAGINALVAARPRRARRADHRRRRRRPRRRAPFCPGIAAVVVKRSVSRFAADSLHPAEACARIREAARRAVDAAGLGESAARSSCRPRWSVAFRNADLAEMATLDRRRGAAPATRRGADHRRGPDPPLPHVHHGRAAHPRPSSSERGHGRVALVTGAAGGIGSAVVARLLRDGFRVGALDVDAAGLARLAEASADVLPLRPTSPTRPRCVRRCRP